MTEIKNILVVDDTEMTLEVIQRNLCSKGFGVFLASDVRTAVDILEDQSIHMVITDLKMPQIGGIELVKYVRDNFPEIPVMMITGYPSINTAVESVKAGAEEYLSKPFTDEELFEKVDSILQRTQIKQVSEYNDPRFEKCGLIGVSKQMKQVFNNIIKASQIDATVLIHGESGTGKEIVARAIHYFSPRTAAPFVPVNCSAIPENLIESELFGYVKGAFTGAVTNRAGFFQTAQNGTIFLDEISNTSAHMQSKLLRVIQEKQFYMLGSNAPRNVELRIVAASNKDLYEMVKKDLFREDLYYRLNVINIDIPPLRCRKDDIMPLLRYFNQKLSREYQRSELEFSNPVVDTLISYEWPGNIRELENLVLRLVAMSDDQHIQMSDLPVYMRCDNWGNTGFTRSLAETEKEYIKNVLQYCNGNKTKAAEILKISRKTLREKLK